MSQADFGILACGAYVPRRRLPHRVIAEAHGWFNPALKSHALKSKASGRRSFAGWDEDAITMAVEAGRNALALFDPSAIEQLDLASTSLPFADRANAGIVREALGLADQIALNDRAGSLRAASETLCQALTTNGPTQLLIGSDCVDARAASNDELHLGHGAAAMVIGSGDPLARLLGAAQQHYDFVDHYRASDARFNYSLEPRWTRDAGYRQQVSETYRQAIANAGVSKVDQLLIATTTPLAKAIARSLEGEHAGAQLLADVGFCGAAQPLLLLSQALQQATAGQTIALVALGQGVQVMVFEALKSPPAAALPAGVEEANYNRYLALRGLLELESGLRAERDNRTALAAFWRKHEALTGFTGGHCDACDTLQFPATRLCVKCGAQDRQQPRRMAELPGSVRSFTEDWLAYTPNPPLMFGNVGFADGANVLMEFTDFEPGQLEVGLPVRLQFRVKDLDKQRQFRRYFWKPTPVAAHG